MKRFRILDEGEIVVSRDQLARAIHDSIVHGWGPVGQDWIERMGCEARAFSYHGEPKCALRADLVIAALSAKPLPEAEFEGVERGTAFGKRENRVLTSLDA